MQIMVPAGKQGPTHRACADSSTCCCQDDAGLVGLGTRVGAGAGALYWFVERRHPESKISRSYFPGIVQALGAMLLVR